MSGKIKGLAHIGVFVKDMETSVKFYRDILGFTVTDVHNNLTFCNIGTCLIELVEIKDYQPRTPGQVDHIAVEVENIEELVAELRAKGVELPEKIGEMPTLLGGVKNIFFVGPDGERIELFEYTNR